MQGLREKTNSYQTILCQVVRMMLRVVRSESDSADAHVHALSVLVNLSTEVGRNVVKCTLIHGLRLTNMVV